MTKKRIALALAACAPALACATDGYFSHGYGMQSKGMGGAAVAIAESAFGAASNPATMVFAGSRFEVGVDLFSPRRDAERTGTPPQAGLNGSSDSDSRYFGIPELAYNQLVNPRLSWGVTVYGNGGMNTDYPGDALPAASACQNFNPGQASYNLLCGSGRLGVDLSQLVIAPSLAYKITPTQSIGVAPLAAYQRFKAEGLQAFDNPVMSTHPGNVTNRGYDSSTGWGVRVGYYAVLDAFAFGASYTSKVSMQEFGKYSGLFAESGGFDMPSHWAAGVAWRAAPQAQLTAEYERINYTDAASVGNASANLLQCLGGNRASCLGGSGGAGFGWHDVNIFKLGAQYDVSPTLTVRGGYNYTQNPIHAEDVTFNILAPGVVQHHITAGATWRIDPASSITTAAMYAFSNDVSGPSFFNNFAQGLALQEKIRMYEWSLGVQYAHRF